jgi:hypothetical protein
VQSASVGCNSEAYCTEWGGNEDLRAQPAAALLRFTPRRPGGIIRSALGIDQALQASGTDTGHLAAIGADMQQRKSPSLGVLVIGADH